MIDFTTPGFVHPDEATDADMIGIVNLAMLGTKSVDGEHVDWDEPDYATEQEWADLLGMPLDDYAAMSPHLAIFVA